MAKGQQQKGRKNKRRTKRSSGANGLALPYEGPFPRTLVKSLKYCDLISMTEASAGAGSSQIYRLHDVYDPDFTATGHQPLYFDQLCTSTGPYMGFVVLRSKFRLRICNTGSTPILLTVSVVPYTTIPANRLLATERVATWTHMLPPVGTGGATVQKVVSTDNAKIAGVPLATYEALMGGNYGTSAGGLVNSFPHYLQILIYGLGASVATAVLHVDAVYTTKFHSIGNIAQS
jgi:hypothetical protein